MEKQEQPHASCGPMDADLPTQIEVSALSQRQEPKSCALGQAKQAEETWEGLALVGVT